MGLGGGGGGGGGGGVAGGGGLGRVSDKSINFFFTKSPNLKRKKLGAGGGGEVLGWGPEGGG